MKPLTEDQLIQVMTNIRRRNNILWMKLLKIAVKSKPRETKTILKQIAKNDQDVTKCMAQL